MGLTVRRRSIPPRLAFPQTNPSNIPPPPNQNSGPQVVLVSSLAFIGVVVLLHIWAKFTSPR